MAKVTREQLLNSAFNDPRNYPYGFARSGDFSISESQALIQYGRLISALVSGQLACANDEDESLLAVAQGEKSPASVAERAWVKYQSRINRPKAGSIYGTNRNNSPASDDSDESDFIDDDDVVLDED